MLNLMLNLMLICVSKLQFYCSSLSMLLSFITFSKHSSLPPRSPCRPIPLLVYIVLKDLYPQQEITLSIDGCLGTGLDITCPLSQTKSPPASTTMPPSALQYRVSCMQHEANLLQDHARQLDLFASELSSFSSTLSYQSHAYNSQSDELNKLAGFIMAGAPMFDADADVEEVAEVEEGLPALRVASQVAKASETLQIHGAVRKMLQALTRILDGREATSDPVGQAITKKCREALKESMTQGHAFAAVCGMAFVEAMKEKAQRGAEIGVDDVEVADAVVEAYSKRPDAAKGAVAAFAESKKHFKSLIKKEPKSRREQRRDRQSSETLEQIREEQASQAMQACISDSDDSASVHSQSRPIHKRTEKKVFGALDWKVHAFIKDHEAELAMQPDGELTESETESESEEEMMERLRPKYDE